MTTDSAESEEVQLAPPGKGLPLIESLLVKYWMFPLAVLKSNQASAQALFSREAEKIVRLTRALSEEDLLTPVLIPRPRGLEDSSRCWSPVMVVEHLLIVGKAIEQFISSLHEGTAPSNPVDIAGVKPTGEVGDEIIHEFEQFCEQFVSEVAKLKLERNGGETHYHPWLGQLNAFQWLCLAAGHMRMHRQQIETILGVSREIDAESEEEELETQ